MNQRPTASATLELTLGGQAPNGRLTDAEGRARRFSGWIELAATIEDWRTSTPQAGSDARPTDEPNH
jgi:hypothetical protein